MPISDKAISLPSSPSIGEAHHRIVREWKEKEEVKHRVSSSPSHSQRHCARLINGADFRALKSLSLSLSP